MCWPSCIKGSVLRDDEDRLYALAELSFPHAEETRNRAYSLASAVYAWALLFPDDGRRTSLQPEDPRYRLAYDLYNQAVANGLVMDQGKGLHPYEVGLAPSVLTLPFGTLHLTLDEAGLSWGGYRLEHFLPTNALQVRDLRNRYRSAGIGAPLAASGGAAEASQKVLGSERLGLRTKIPVTALLRFDHARAGLASGQVRGRIEVYATDETPTVKIDGREQLLESDPTAALACQLEGNPLYGAVIVGFFPGTARFGAQCRETAPRTGRSCCNLTNRGRFPWCWCME